MEVQIKLTKEQHDLLLDRLGSEESIREWLQHSLDRRIQEMVGRDVPGMANTMSVDAYFDELISLVHKDYATRKNE